MKRFFPGLIMFLFAVSFLTAEDPIVIDETNIVNINYPVEMKYNVKGNGEEDIILQDYMRQITPVGAIQPYTGDTPPEGWLLCDGLSVSDETYPALFAVIGTKFGDGSDGNGNFNLPDLRGVFLRGLDTRDPAESRDPDAASRTDLQTGEVTGAVVGSYQADAFQNHVHSYTDTYRPGTSEGGRANMIALADNVFKGTGKLTSLVISEYKASSETRPKNVSVNYIIKY